VGILPAVISIGCDALMVRGWSVKPLIHQLGSIPSTPMEEIRMTEQELFELELETEEGECFTLGYAIGKYCVKQLFTALQGDKNE
jgi:hypothetical protein